MKLVGRVRLGSGEETKQNSCSAGEGDYVQNKDAEGGGGIQGDFKCWGGNIEVCRGNEKDI